MGSELKPWATVTADESLGVQQLRTHIKALEELLEGSTREREQHKARLSARIETLEEELTELRAERDAWRRSLVEETPLPGEADLRVLAEEEDKHDRT